ncbi:MAG: hypothetical protein K9N51_09605 [Candidatus Pacebacteria bacterium]|nr:hypothetical protein [Candidatus Paceibacterota bacterium]
MSIRTQLVLSLTVLATAVAVLVGWQSSRVVSRAVEERLVHDSVTNAAGLVAELNLPLSERLMQQLSTVLNCEIAAVQTPQNALLASSFTIDEESRSTLTRFLTEEDPGTKALFSLRGTLYRVGTAKLTGLGSHQAKGAPGARLLVLMPEARLRSARREAAVQIAVLTVLAIMVAAGVGVLVSAPLTRPVHKLLERMEHVSDAVRGVEDISTLEGISSDTGETRSLHTLLPPAHELMRLSNTFDHLLSRLREAHRRLGRAARLAVTGQMSAGVAHELRNPLSSIKMNARLLLDDPHLTDDSRTAVNLIFNEIERMDLYLQELLALPAEESTVEATKTAAYVPEARLDEVVDSVLCLFEDRARRNHITFERSYKTSADLTAVAADPQRLRQLVMNLVVNALEAAPSHSQIQVTIDVPEEDRIRLAVSDTGSGIDPSVADSIFEPFVTTKPRGTGLGLYICRRIAEHYNGTMGHSRSAHRNTVWFMLPIITQDSHSG